MSLNGFQLNSSFSIIYQANIDGFSAKSFHAKCNGFGKTLVIIKSKNGYIFGGYTEADWSGSGEYKYDSKAFLFSLVNAYNTPVKMNISNPSYAIYSNPSYGPTFGYNHDLYFSDQSNPKNGYSNLGYSYKLPNFLTYGSTEAQSFLAGSKNFRIAEIEVFGVYIERKNL